MSARERYVEAARKVAQGERDAGDLASLAQEAAAEEMVERRERVANTWTAWTPPSAPHVTGRWTGRVLDDNGLPEEQRVEAECKHCKAIYKRACTSGLVRQHVLRFAHVHAGCKAP